MYTHDGFLSPADGRPSKHTLCYYYYCVPIYNRSPRLPVLKCTFVVCLNAPKTRKSVYIYTLPLHSTVVCSSATNVFEFKFYLFIFFFHTNFHACRVSWTFRNIVFFFSHTHLQYYKVTAEQAASRWYFRLSNPPQERAMCALCTRHDTMRYTLSNYFRVRKTFARVQARMFHALHCFLRTNKNQNVQSETRFYGTWIYFDKTAEKRECFWDVFESASKLNPNDRNYRVWTRHTNAYFFRTP